MVRHGLLEEVCWTHSRGPVDDEAAPSGVGGVLVVCTEATRARSPASSAGATT